MLFLVIKFKLETATEMLAELLCRIVLNFELSLLLWIMNIGLS